nr:ribonuclease H-like domain-containing protein [Tanacetum cinerariifolium]
NGNNTNFWLDIWKGDSPLCEMFPPMYALELEKQITVANKLAIQMDSSFHRTVRGDKTGLGYDGHVNESKVHNNVVDSCERDGDDNQVNDWFKKSEGYHAVPPPYIGNYMPPRDDLSFAGLDKLDSEDKNVLEPKEVKKIVKPSLEKIEFINFRNTTVENENKAEKPRKFSQSPRGNKRNWNGLMTQKLRDGFEFKKKACFVSAVLTKSGQVPVNTAKQSSHRTATSVSTARHVNTVATRSHVNNDLPTTYSYFKAHSPDQRIFDNGCSRHMIGNKSYLIDYQEIDGGFVAFRGNAKRGKITRKGKIKTGKLDFEDVYFVKELKFNLFSVS